MKREIAKNLKCPKLSKEAINLLSKLCFIPQKIEEADLIFVFGSRFGMDDNTAAIKELLDEDIAKRVILTGGNPQFDDLDTMGDTEAEILLKMIDVKKYPHVAFYSENKSHHTLANVTEAMEIIDFDEIKKIVFVTKSFASRRGYLSLRKLLPKQKLMTRTYGAIYPDSEHRITKNSWHKFEEGRNRVWGEFLRIAKYGRRGDIEFREVEALVKQIELITIKN